MLSLRWFESIVFCREKKREEGGREKERGKNERGRKRLPRCRCCASCFPPPSRVGDRVNARSRGKKGEKRFSVSNDRTTRRTTGGTPAKAGRSSRSGGAENVTALSGPRVATGICCNREDSIETVYTCIWRWCVFARLCMYQHIHHRHPRARI